MVADHRVATNRWPAHYTVVLLLCAATFISYIDRTNISVGAIAMQAQFGWDETQKGLVFSAFFVGYLLMMTASGALAHRFGGWIVLGVAVVWWSLFTALTPPAALISLPALVVARIALGLGEAAVFPASINLIGSWVPPEQRSRAVAMVASSLYLGTVAALPATGWLVRSYGWPSPFYIFGAIGLVWAAFWLAGIDHNGGKELPPESGVRAIPWLRLLRLPAVWAIMVAHFCHNWVLYLLLAWLPTYFKRTFGVSLVDAGLLSAAPWLVGFVMSNIAGAAVDRMLASGRNATFVRKAVMALGLGGCALAIVALPIAPSLVAALLLMCCAAGALSMCNAGFPPNCFDIAPRYSGVIFGISNTTATLPGIFGAVVTGWLVDRTGSFTVPFFATAGVAAVGVLTYLAIGSAERQID
jgi:MFS transporter, ACS family, solute carrier family 17 (sodium-dependent inorganic phosphate cotransporter), other